MYSWLYYSELDTLPQYIMYSWLYYSELDTLP